MTSRHLTRIAAACALGTALVLGACTSSDQSGQSEDQSGSPSGAQSGAQSGSACALATDPPDVDRSGDANFPDATGGFGEEPTISAGEGTEPDQVVVSTLAQGDGPEISQDDVVLTDYAGTLWDGTVFDSSYQRGSQTAFSLDAVIPGWQYALIGQHVGDRVEVVIPCEWGYGDQENSSIPAGSTLVFVVDIHDALNGTDTSALTEATPTDDDLPTGVAVTGDLGSEPSLEFSGDTPPEQSTTVLATGAGEPITDTQYVVYQAVGSYFEDPESTQSSWGQAPQVFAAGIDDLVDIPVGSRVLFVFPPAADAAQSGTTEQETWTTVMVIDILGVLTPQS